MYAKQAIHDPRLTNGRTTPRMENALRQEDRRQKTRTCGTCTWTIHGHQSNLHARPSIWSLLSSLLSSPVLAVRCTLHAIKDSDMPRTCHRSRGTHSSCFVTRQTLSVVHLQPCSASLLVPSPPRSRSLSSPSPASPSSSPPLTCPGTTTYVRPCSLSFFAVFLRSVLMLMLLLMLLKT